MKTRINSPDMFEQKLRVSGTRMWVLLSVLTVLIAAGLILFLSNRIVVTEESDFCYVFEDTMTYREAMTEAIRLASPKYAHMYEDFGQTNNGYPPDGTVQPAFLLFSDNDQTICEGMPLKVQGRSGEVLTTALPVSFQQLIENGNSEKELLKAGFVPNGKYTFICAVLYLPEGTEPLPEGRSRAEVVLDELEPATLILK